MFRTLLLSGAILAGPAWATVYYVDHTAGSDAASGLSPSDAWQTLAHASTQKLQPGDYVLLNRGATWTEPLIITSSGNELAPITFGAYGSSTVAPTINGRGIGYAVANGVVNVTSQHDIVLTGITIENSGGMGINVYEGLRVTMRNLTVTGNQHFGMLIFNSNQITIDGNQVYSNALDTTTSWDGIRIDGDTGTYHDFLITNNSIHDQIGGAVGWTPANGLFLGHTTANFTTLKEVRVLGNNVYSNGNPAQNQAGRGITGTLNGDVTVEGNYIHENASAGLYLGDEGMQLTLLLDNNTFYDNALRQFGGYTTLTARATRNVCLVDNPNITAMGVEIGGTGSWDIEENTFFYLTTTTDTYRGYMRLNDAATQPGLTSNHNLFYSPTLLAWVLPSGARVNFSQWQSLGFDLNSQNPQ
jgi:parallel beta-helix repeat protein